MNAVSEDIKDMLEAQSSLGLVFKTNLFIGREPKSPNNTVTIFDTPGAPPMKTLTPGENYYYDSFQIRLRTTDYQTGYALLKSIEEYLHVISQQTVNETYYSIIYCSLPITMLDWDDNNRVHLVATFEVQRRDLYVPAPDIPSNIVLSATPTTISIAYTCSYPVEIWMFVAGVYIKLGTSESSPYLVEGLTLGVTYYFKFRSVNDVVYSDFTSIYSKVTAEVIPVAPSNLVLTVLSDVAIQLDWTDNSDNETGFSIEQSTDGVAYSEIDTVTAGVTTYNATRLTENTEYFYRVRAFRSTVYSEYCTAQSETTEYTQPGVPTLGTLVVISDTEITVPYTSDYPVEIWYSTNNVTYTKHGDDTVTPYAMTGLTAATLYYVKTRAVNGSKYSDYTTALSAYTFTTEMLSLVARYTTPPTNTNKTLIDKTIRDLKSSGLWDKFSVLQLYHLEDSQSSLLNFKGDVYNATLPEKEPYFIKHNGFRGNLVDKYLNTGYNPVGSLYERNNASVGCVIRDIGSVGIYTAFGSVKETVTFNINYLNNFNVTTQIGQINCAAYSTGDNVSLVPIVGITTLARNSAEGSLVYQNKDRIFTSFKDSNGVPNQNIFALASNNKGAATQFHNCIISGFYAGAYISNDEHNTLCDILNYFYDNYDNTITGNIIVIGDSTIDTYLNQNAVSWFLRGYSLVTDVSELAETIAQQKTRYEALAAGVKSGANYVFVQIGLNDLNPAESAATALTRYQGLIDSINTSSAFAKIVLGTMTPCKQRLIDLYGAVNGLVAYQKWIDMNEAIKGNGDNAITGMDATAYVHTSTLNDGSGNLKAEYEIVGTVDHIHENNEARLIIAQSWMAEK
jgi:hypothetical protein